jgi:hypothetical protein
MRADKNGNAMVLKASQGNVPAEAEPQKGHRRGVHSK